MDNLWSNVDTLKKDDLDLLVYQSLLIGADSSLVAWGGGNTSIKITEQDFRGLDTNTLFIKGSGSDMKAIERKHFPGLRLDDILPLFDRDFMSDEEMVDYLSKCMLNPNDPRPSIETLLHAFLPHKSVAHSHADAVVALTNTLEATDVLQRVFGDRVAVVEYIRPGFILSKRVGQALKSDSAIEAVVLSNHGLFTWGSSAKEAYDKHIEMVTLAESYTKDKSRGKVIFTATKAKRLEEPYRRQIAATIAPTIRGLVSQLQPMVLRYDDSLEVLDFVDADQAAALSQIGPATPDHLLQTKQKPLWINSEDLTDTERLTDEIRLAIETYVSSYEGWYKVYSSNDHPMLDPHPRVILIPGIGMWTTGKDSRAALIAGEIYHHTIQVLKSAQSVGQYTSLSDKDAYEAEYWPMELYKLTLAPPERELSRRIALVTGAANGIGKAIAHKLAAEGAHVLLTDIDSRSLESQADQLNNLYPGRAATYMMDVTSEDQVADAFNKLRLTYGGLDILVSNAGIAAVGSIDRLPLDAWRKAFDVNATGHFLVAREAIKIMSQQSMGGSIVMVGTKNITSPGKDFGAYSSSKAAEAQLARILAIENGDQGIRCNVVNPDAVFEGSNLWSQEVKEQRSKAHGVSVDGLQEFYRQRNLLNVSISASDVAEAVLFLASKRSGKTTGAMLPVDGGVPSAFPR